MIDPAQIKAYADYSEQLAKYADAVTGVAYVQSLAFCYKLTDDPFTERIITKPGIIFPSVAVGTAVYLVVVMLLYHGMCQLSAGNDNLVGHFQHWIEIGRIVTIFFTGVATCAAFQFTRSTRKPKGIASNSTES